MFEENILNYSDCFHLTVLDFTVLILDMSTFFDFVIHLSEHFELRKTGSKLRKQTKVAKASLMKSM